MKSALSSLYILLIIIHHENHNKYKEGVHSNYLIICENGLIYKLPSKSSDTIQVLNSDGTPLKCGDKIH